jgi:class 3 adenylate cyclase
MILFGAPSEVLGMPALWVYLGIGTAWPHVALLLARRAKDSRRAERRNVLGDSFTFGANPTLLGFQLWPSAAIMVIALINSLMFGGVRFLITSLVPMAIGVVASIIVFGPRLQLDSAPSVIALSVTAIAFYVGLIGVTAYQLRVRQRATRAALEREEQKSQDLLANVFPHPVIPRLRAGEAPIADQFADVTVVFVDMVEFTPLAERLGPKRTVLLLNDLFQRFDQAAHRYGVEKIETTGDGYLAVGGAPAPLNGHAGAVADFARATVEAARATAAAQAETVQVRVGIHTGPVFGGVIGESRFHYKVFGETVNVASRVQSHSQPGRILVSEATQKRIAGTHRLQEHGLVELKGHGPMRTYWLL